ncbi:uncharacterized protein LOC143902993 [Temnothorax americanus]|uniref:uncharacterized protein LOC143902993 n=1 Tax=Temnothorax americanus TaxID=1964332 RepID=UPI00406785B5
MKNSNQSFEKSIKNFDATLIPPCKAKLFQQLMRVLYVSNIWCNAHLQFPSTFGNPDSYGWKLSEGTYSFHWFNGKAMPTTINEIVIENLNDEETEQQDNDQSIEDEKTLSSDEDIDEDSDKEKEILDDSKINEATDLDKFDYNVESDAESDGDETSNEDD